MGILDLFRSMLLWIKKQTYLLVMALTKSLFGLDIHKHLSHPGTGLGKWIVSRVFKNNNAANDTLVSLMRFPDHAQVVEIGFGLGDTLKTALATAPPSAKFCGYELSESMLEDAKRNLHGDESRVELSLRDCAKDGIPFESETVDVVYHANVLYFVPDPLAFVKESCRVLKRGGMLGMNVIQPNELGSDLPSDTPFKNLLSEDELVKLCKDAGFETVTITHYTDALRRMLVVATK